MLRALPVARRSASLTENGAVKVVRRRLATEAADVASSQKKSSFRVRRLVILTAGATGTFYIGSAFVSYHNDQYRTFFEKNIPLAPAVLDFGEQRDWDTLTVEDVISVSGAAFVSTYGWVQKQIGHAKDVSASASEKMKQTSDAAKAATSSAAEKAKEASTAMSRKAKEVAGVASEKAQQAKTAVATTAKDAQTTAAEVSRTAEEKARAAAAITAKKAKSSVPDISALIKEAEAALAGVTSDVAAKAESPIFSTSDPDVYSAPLPLGFEPPPGYRRPSPPKPKSKPAAEPSVPAPEPLPLLAPTVAELAASEPVIAHLAHTIDELTAFLKANPSAATQARSVLDTAQADLKQLASDFERLREEERRKLEQSLDEQAREYSLKLLEVQLDAGDKLGAQEEEFRRLYDQERERLAQVFREKLDQELLTQSELIDERLREEVIAQGIELQRRWIREVKVRVEQERGGRLAKLEELAANIKKLERVAMDNSTYLDDNLRIHSMWSALRALHVAIGAPTRKPFRDELRVLRHIAAAKEDLVVSVALEALEASDAPDVGVEPLADLTTWFTSSVAPAVSRVALVPDSDAGVLSHIASHIFSTFVFRRQGLVPGSDVVSVLSRAEHYLNQKDLDSAARELNQLKGTARALLADWLDAARRRLEVEQALQVVESEATLKSLLVV